MDSELRQREMGILLQNFEYGVPEMATMTYTKMTHGGGYQHLRIDPIYPEGKYI